MFVLNSSWDNVISKFGKRLFRQELQLLAKELQFLEIEILAQAAIGNETNEALSSERLVQAQLLPKIRCDKTA